MFFHIKQIKIIQFQMQNKWYHLNYSYYLRLIYLKNQVIYTGVERIQFKF